MPKPHYILVIIFTFYGSLFPFQISNLNTEQNAYDKIYDDANHFFNIGFDLATSPFSFDSDDWLKTGIVTLGTASLFTIDKNIKTISLKNLNSLDDQIFNFDSYHGNLYTAIFSASLYGYGLIGKNDEIRRLGLNALEAFTYSGIITGILKVAIGRRRPYAGDDQLYFKPLSFTNNDFQSLPSGHTTVSFAVSTVMANYLDNIYWKIFWYGAGGMVAASRIYHNKHWISDVFLGGSIGYVVGRYVVNKESDNQTRILGSKIQPYFSFNRVGLLFVW
jgi:membrane-associated phospholipid phosphatase